MINPTVNEQCEINKLVVSCAAQIFNKLGIKRDCNWTKKSLKLDPNWPLHMQKTYVKKGLMPESQDGM